jgi:hypothetical protein
MPRPTAPVLAPYINSYKRFARAPSRRPRRSGRMDNRTAGFRLCGAGHGRARRMPDAGSDMNPYLAWPRCWRQGWKGIEEGLPSNPNSPAMPTMPTRARSPAPCATRARPARLGDAARGDGRRCGRPLCPCGEVGTSWISTACDRLRDRAGASRKRVTMTGPEVAQPFPTPPSPFGEKDAMVMGAC